MGRAGKLELSAAGLGRVYALVRRRTVDHRGGVVVHRARLGASSLGCEPCAVAEVRVRAGEAACDD